MELLSGGYASPRWSWELLDCAMPMTFDTYDNCAFQCVYCFSFFQRAVGSGKDDYLHHRVRAVDVEKVKALFLGQIPKSQFNWYIKRRYVLQWGGLSDGFDYYERKFRKSLELMRFFRQIDYPISISTKGVWFTEDPEYAEVFKDAKNVHVKSSIISLDTDKVRKVERGAATSEERFRMLEWMNKQGVAATTVRFRPFILGMSADYPWGPKAKDQIWAFMRRAKDAGVYSVTTEFLCLESRASNTARDRYTIISQATGIPMFELYKQVSQARSGLLRLNYDIKRPYIEEMKEACDALGLKFFVSDAHHKEKSASAGCCGLPADGPLSNYNRGQFAQAILIAKKVGKVHWGDIEEQARPFREVKFFAAEGFNQGGTDERVKRMYQTMYDYMRDIWNNPKSGMSPARYFGGALVPGKPDENGDIVYYYNQPYVLDSVRVQSVAELTDRLHQNGLLMGEDGSEYGHVAYPVVVNGAYNSESEGEQLKALVGKLLNNRLNCRVYLPRGSSGLYDGLWTGVDIVELPAADLKPEEAEQVILVEEGMAGNERIWVVGLGATFLRADGSEATPRAAMSLAEASYLEAVGKGEIPFCPVGTQILDTAPAAPDLVRERPATI